MTSQGTADHRLSTYSGAPSLQPSLAPTFATQDYSPHPTNTTTTSTTRYSTSRHTPILLTPEALSEKHQILMHYQNSLSAASTATLAGSTDPKTQDLNDWNSGFERMQDARFERQRYVMTSGKSDEVSKLALGAKVERALGRRMVGQDAVFRKKKTIDGEKRSLEVSVN